MTWDWSQSTQDVVFRTSSPQPGCYRISLLIPTLCWHSIAMPCLQSPLSVHLLTGVAFFKERIPPYLPLPPGHTSSSVPLFFKPSAFLFLSSNTLLIVSAPNTHWQVDTRKLNTGQTFHKLFDMLRYLCTCTYKKNYLDIREEGFQHVGAGVAGVEEHELRLLQVTRGEALLDVHVNVKEKKPTENYTAQHTVPCKVIGDQSIVLPQSSAKLNFTKEQLGIN